MTFYCKQCGIPITQHEAEHSAYCPFCKARRFKQPVEMDPETGKWEGT